MCTLDYVVHCVPFYWKFLIDLINERDFFDVEKKTVQVGVITLCVFNVYFVKQIIIRLYYLISESFNAVFNRYYFFYY